MALGGKEDRTPNDPLPVKRQNGVRLIPPLTLSSPHTKAMSAPSGGHGGGVGAFLSLEVDHVARL
jgi:hypothetical protein